MQNLINNSKSLIEYTIKNKGICSYIGGLSADTSFFGYKTHIVMTPERIITAAVVTSGEQNDGNKPKNL